jgi:hypothetical protein
MRFLVKMPIEGIDSGRKPTYYRSIKYSGAYSYEALVKAALFPTQVLPQSLMHESSSGEMEF